ncbi:hypothetical protein COF80_27030 [Bacillus toyonensis]|uniref:DGQHR domain-containing protein n=1 Tax=Bacillus toyonensis TaxID=155322 RepID=UPI000BFC2A4C|nr:DGQHR domain-containing protein [Bacillus toyonensis]PHE82682.1 hypothetical protein COF80_27030 [Bacillus toyonensis]
MKKIRVLQYKWGKNNNYLGLIPYKFIPDYINVDKDQSMNREVDLDRVEEIIKYIEKNADNLFFPPVILNSDSGITFDSKKMEISFDSSNKAKVIDGQHRLTAIKKITRDQRYKHIKDKVQNYEIPFVLVESLEPEEHRTLFNEINKKAEKVGRLVSERFEPTIQNLICLRYIAENDQYEKWVEWEIVQSEKKLFIYIWYDALS